MFKNKWLLSLSLIFCLPVLVVYADSFENGAVTIGGRVVVNNLAPARCAQIFPNSTDCLGLTALASST